MNREELIEYLADLEHTLKIQIIYLLYFISISLGNI